MKEKKSLAQYEGKVIFINIWATWCAPCIAEMPGINDLYNDLKNENIQFVLFSVDDEFENALAFIKRKEYSFPIYHSGGNIPPLYQTGTIPTTFIIDTKGNLVLEHQGMANYNSDEFKNFLRTLMGT
ncbi:MAG TPA: TlpA disulfide reductase family protein [Flavobacteriaceae bacterium]|nr:TlpA disulfide reductase family protein [Flavobacteriaceae bacterium]